MAIAERGGFAAAARSLGVSQPAISRHVRALERRMGCTLFDKAPGRTPQLTERGRRVVDTLPGLLAQFRAVDLAPRAAAHGQDIVRIGCGDVLAERIAALIPELRTRLPEVVIALRTFDPSLSAVLKLQDIDIDLAYLTLRSPPAESIAERIATVPAGLYLPAQLVSDRAWTPDHPLPVISAPDNSFLSRDFEQTIRICGIAAHRVVARVITQRDRVRLALAGVGAVLSMDADVRQLVADGLLQRIGTRGITLHRCRFVNATRIRDRTVREVERFLSGVLSAG